VPGCRGVGQTRHRVTRSRVLAVLVAGWLCLTAAGPPGRAASVAGAWEDGTYLLSVTAKEVPLEALLLQVARLADFQIEGVPVTDRTVSIELDRWPLDRALRRLLQLESFVFVSSGLGDGGALRPGRLMLLGSGRARDTMSPPETTPLAQAAPEVGFAAFNPDAPLGQLLPFIADKHGSVRTAALEALTGHAEDPLARRLLLEHISDPDPEVRSFALTLLAPYVAQWSGAEDVVLTAVLDRVPSIRQLALQVLVESSSSRGAEAMRLARMDPDAEVRAWADELLRKAGVGPHQYR